MKLKRLAKNLLLLFITVVIFLFFLELGVRIFSPADRMTRQFDKEAGVMVGIPNIEFKTRTEEFGLLTHKNNSRGFNDSEYNYKKEENTYRIIVLGDSWVQAVAVPLDRTFHKILETKLNELKINKKFEVISFGVGGFNTGDEYLVLKKIGLKYNPDLVMLLVYPGNDIMYNSLEITNEPVRPYFDLENGTLKLVKESKTRSKNNKLITFINRYFSAPRFLYRKIQLVKYKYYSFKSKLEGEEKEPEKKEPIAEALKGVNLSLLRDTHLYAKEYDERCEKAWQITKALIEEMKNISQQNGADFLLMSIPDQWAVNPNLWNQILIQYPSLKKVEWDLEKPNRILREFSQDKDINYLELLLAFRKNLLETGKELYIDHFNSRGHELTADLIYQFLINNNLIKD